MAVRYTTVDGQVLCENRGGVKTLFMPDTLGNVIETRNMDTGAQTSSRRADQLHHLLAVRRSSHPNWHQPQPLWLLRGVGVLHPGGAAHLCPCPLLPPQPGTMADGGSIVAVADALSLCKQSPHISGCLWPCSNLSRFCFWTSLGPQIWKRSRQPHTRYSRSS